MGASVCSYETNRKNKRITINARREENESIDLSKIESKDLTKTSADSKSNTNTNNNTNNNLNQIKDELKNKDYLKLPCTRNQSYSSKLVKKNKNKIKRTKKNFNTEILNHNFNNNNNLIYINKKYINIVILGGPNTGKSAFAIRYSENKFENYYIPSIMNEYKTKLIEGIGENEFKINFCVFSNDFNEKSRKEIYKKADIFFIFYDITNENSIQYLNKYINEIKNNCPDKSEENIYLIGNKIDLEKDRKINKNFVNTNYNYKIFEISVKNFCNINSLMLNVIKNLNENL